MNTYTIYLCKGRALGKCNIKKIEPDLKIIIIHVVAALNEIQLGIQTKKTTVYSTQCIKEVRKAQYI